MTTISPMDFHRLLLKAVCLWNEESTKGFSGRRRGRQVRRKSRRADPISADSPRPDPRRQATGRKSRAMRGEVSEAGRASLREAIQKSQPWTKSTGPRTPAGKARSALNGKRRQKGLVSVRELRRYRDTLRERLLPLKKARQILDAVLQSVLESCEQQN